MGNSKESSRESRKKRNMEIEKLTKQRKRMWSLMFAGAALVIIAAISWVVWDAQNRQWIMTFEGTRVSTGDLRFFASQVGVPINAETRQAFVDDLLNSLVILHRADALGLGLTPEEHAELTQNAATSRELMMQMHHISMDFISDERIAEIIGSVGIVAERLMDHYIPEYPTHTAEFAAAFAEWREENEENLSAFNVKYMSGFSEESLEEVRRQYVEEGIEFAELEGAFSTSIDEHGLSWAVNLSEFFEQYPGLAEFEEEIREVDEGEWSRVFQVGAVFYMIYVETKVVADEDEMRDQFVFERRAHTFVEMLADWIEAANFRINTRVFESFV